MVGINASELTEDEAELYDRQIRLWGLESQKRLRSSKILLIGLQGFGAEVAKNVILAGVKSITLLDNGLLTEDDACSQFLAPRDQIGKNRAQASLSRAQQLNPMVQVVADTSSVDDKADSFFGQFDVVCTTECTTDQQIRINQVCREMSVKFFCGDVFGLFGYTFADLQIHEFVDEVTVHSSIQNVESGEPSTKIAKVEPIKVSMKEIITYVPLQDALNVDWKNDTCAVKHLAKLDPSYFLMKVLHRFRSEVGRNPSPSECQKDLDKLLVLKEDELAKLGVPTDKIPDHLLRNIFAEVSPVCAIVGGVMAQEIIKAVSQKERPHNNMFFFNPSKTLGIVECIGNYGV